MTCDAYEHLTRVAVELRDTTLLPAVADRLGWRYMELAAVANVVGPGVLPVGWRYPIVVKDGQASYANFSSAEGNATGVAGLTWAYTIERAKRAADEAGYEWEEQGDRLVIYQPGGVIVTVNPAGTIEVNRFDLVEGDPSAYLQDALGTVTESAYGHWRSHAQSAQQENHQHV
ncbi:MAG: hypothetical protein ACYDAG_05015 [Chloroflexota bacterium]